MTDAPESNGHEELPSAPPPGVPSQADQMRDALDARIGSVMLMAVAGVLQTCPGVPAHEVLNSICRVVGKVAASSVQADLQTLFQLRKGFQEAFHAGVKSAPLSQPPGQPGASRPNA